MRTPKVSISFYRNISVNTPFGGALFNWPGGSGWLTVNGTFTGAAGINIIGNTDLATFNVLATPAAATGSYFFNSPPGLLLCQLEGVGSVSNLNAGVASSK